VTGKVGAFLSGFFKRPELRRVERMGIASETQPMVGKLFPNSPAENAGLLPNDVIVEANGQRVTSMVMISDLIQANPEQPLNLVVDRGGQRLPLSVTPALPKNAEKANIDKPMLGIRWDDTGVTVLKRTPPGEQIQDSVETMYNTLSAVVSPSSSISAKHLSGPVGIMRLYYRLFEHKDGWRLALWFTVVLNINLAILNLLPLPVLDGGHITMALIEAVRRRPLSKPLLDVAYGGCAILLIGFMLFITGFDVTDWFGGDGGGGGGASVREEPVF
jgi:regulator of sigma E protease